jgi:hypothetical protein
VAVKVGTILGTKHQTIGMYLLLIRR